MQKVVHGKTPQYLKDLMIPSEGLHVHGNKQLLSRARIDIFKTSFSFSGSLARNSFAHHLRYPMELQIFQTKAFQAVAKPPWFLIIIMYIDHALINALSAHMIHINLNIIFYTHM